MLVSSLSAAFVTGRTLYGQNVRTLDEVFDLIDKDKGGTVDRYELGAALNRMGLGLKPAHVDALMEVFDEDGGGEIERHEFHNVMKRGGWGRPRKLPWERARGKPPPTEDLEQPAETTKPTKGLGERDQENVLRVLVASLERGFKEGRSLYGRKIRSLAEFFNEVDKDGSGSVDLAELTQALKRLGLGLKPKHVEALMELFDEDKSGEVDWAEFQKIMRRGGWGQAWREEGPILTLILTSALINYDNLGRTLTLPNPNHNT